MQNVLSYNPTLVSPSFDAHYTFTAAKYDEATWQRLLPDSLEGYRYHLAFELGKVAGFKTGYISITKSGTVVCIAPIFITEYVPDTREQGLVGPFTHNLSRLLSQSRQARLLCVGSPVTDTAQIGFFRDQPLDIEVIRLLNEKLEQVAEREGAEIIAFKDLTAADSQQLAPLLAMHSYASVANTPVAKISIDFKDLNAYMATLDQCAREDLRSKVKQLDQLNIEEHNGLPPHMEQIHRLYLNSHDKREPKFEKLTIEFFESLAGLMPNQCRFVLYYLQEKLVGFNCLLLGNGVLMDKYTGIDYTHSEPMHLHSLSWLYNLQMCLRDGLHTLQSSRATHDAQLNLGAKLEQTYTLFKRRDKMPHPKLQLASNGHRQNAIGAY